VGSAGAVEWGVLLGGKILKYKKEMKKVYNLSGALFDQSQGGEAA